MVRCKAVTIAIVQLIGSFCHGSRVMQQQSHTVKLAQWVQKQSSTASLLCASWVAAGVIAFGSEAALAEGMPGTAGCVTRSDPTKTIVTCARHGLDRDGRLFSCRSSENCVRCVPLVCS